MSTAANSDSTANVNSPEIQWTKEQDVATNTQTKASQGTTWLRSFVSELAREDKDPNSHIKVELSGTIKKNKH